METIEHQISHLLGRLLKSGHHMMLNKILLNEMKKLIMNLSATKEQRWVLEFNQIIHIGYAHKQEHDNGLEI